MSFDSLSKGENVLFVAPATVDQSTFIKVKSSAQQQVGIEGQTAFEVFDRVAEAPLNKSSFNVIYSNLFPPSVSIHTSSIFSRYLNTLTAGGRLVLEEVVLLVDLANTVCPITRRSSDLQSLLKLAGFVDVTVKDVTPVNDATLAAYFSLWGTTRIEQGVSRLSGKFGIAHIEAKKPTYEIGQKISLNFGKNKNNNKRAVWANVSTDDLEDEDALLDESDKVKPSKESLTRPDDCELTDGKRKACKNCTCGRAEEEEGSMEQQDNVVSLDLMDDFEDEVVEVDPTPKKTGGCGSCALGDAFRCSTCPYLGMPAFNTGEKIALGGMFAQDDIEF
ncbi:cytokine-induced anti-apoptosis inhibitor 1, Fe-S biogenesis-domain-containing protein [Cokeromyces recurvatus]|uniref:cytokine-induced anti-apoptosis inhibitor 1, Fe-S biogenesis-domain-containing protein n=1 Tax=Cokeromyces recurvatus TaxID=90255 RepID=UPI002220DA2C|nr:cytokine-induced anti-apoptosis inhibitor 1, Fe-S biogenesis-domain-containing protein [Cokeromyces recurvatus]KAI7904289.1 cytokine-induced anti-apoptosis inhibitor 1, Fe-S biogenesis-domain-containing protein [Cokeromyces recurvatus]